MGTREDVQTSAQALGSPDAALRRKGAAKLVELARSRASLLPVRDLLLAALTDSDEDVQTDAALGLLTDVWRFQGLVPVLDALHVLRAGLLGAEVHAALVAAAGARGDVAAASSLLIPLLAKGLPGTATELAQLGGQGGDLGPALPAIEAAGPLPGTAQGRELGALWLAALGRAGSDTVAKRADALRIWLNHDESDWRFDDLRYRAAALLANLALLEPDSGTLAYLTGHPRYPVREGAVDVLATELAAGRHVATASGVLLDHLCDAAGGVRYGAIQGVVRAVTAGVDLKAARQTLFSHLEEAAYLATGWTHPLDTIASSDLGSESAAADLAGAVAALARQAGDDALLEALRRHPKAEVARAVAAAGTS